MTSGDRSACSADPRRWRALKSIHYNLRDTVNGHFIRRNIKTIYPNDIACRWSFELIVWPIDRWINKRAFSGGSAAAAGSRRARSFVWGMLMNRCFNNKVPPAAAERHKFSWNSLEWLLIQTFVCHTRWTPAARTGRVEPRKLIMVQLNCPAT